MIRAILTRTSRKLSRTLRLNQKVRSRRSGTIEKAARASRQSSQKSTPTMPASSRMSPKIATRPADEHLVQGVHVGRHPGHQPADRVAVVEGDGQPLQVAEDLPAQVVHHVLPHELHQIALGVQHDEGQDQGGEVDARGHRQPLETDGAGIDPPGQEEIADLPADRREMGVAPPAAG